MEKFYNREQQLSELRAITAGIEHTQGQLSVVVGRRRVGKTRLLNEAFAQQSGLFLYLFISQLKHSGQFNRIGSDWNNKGEHEIDIVAINDLEKRLLVVEVKRQSKRFKPEQLAAKTEQLLQKLNCPGYNLEQRCFALDNLEQVFAEFSWTTTPKPLHG